MNAATFCIPPALGRLLARLPPQPPAWLFVQGLNRLLAPQLPDDVRQALYGRRLRLRIEDAGLAIDFSWQGDSFGMARHTQPDLVIGACAHDLLRMARRQEDPDTLFFSRRLVLEGDTELGLLFKNTLDALDASALDWRRLLPGRN